MLTGTPDGPGRSRLVVLAALLLGHQTLVNLRELTTPAYAASNLAVAAVLLDAARRAGFALDELGLGPRAWRRGPTRGGAVGLAAGAGLSAVLAVPALRPLLRDARLAGVDDRELMARVLVRIPLGTVVLEEVAFRGVLPAVLRRAGLPVGLADALFGLWHVPPALAMARINGVTSARGRWSAAAGAVASTTAAGAGFRHLAGGREGGGLPATALAHALLNGAATITSVAAHRLDLRPAPPGWVRPTGSSPHVSTG